MTDYNMISELAESSEGRNILFIPIHSPVRQLFCRDCHEAESESRYVQLTLSNLLPVHPGLCVLADSSL